MKIQDIVSEAAETLRGLDMLAHVPVIEEDKGDVATKLQAAIGKTSLCVLVGWDGFAPVVQRGTAPNGRIFGTSKIVVTVFERPVVNRRNAASPRLLDVAQEVARALQGASSEGMDAPLFLNGITQISELGSGSDGSVVMAGVEFVAKTSL